MSYIDREAFLAEQRHLYCENCARRKNGKGKFVYDIGDAPCRACDIMDVLDAVEDAPAADVRPVVFCKDCKWYQIDELKKDGTADRRYKPSVCVLAEQRRDPNHFCADGVKREES
jgi:hypothetical protein